MKKNWFAALLAPAIVAAGLGYAFFVTYKPNDGKGQEPGTNVSQRDAVTACESSVRQRMHDPDSAQFPPRSEFKVIPISEPSSYDVIVNVRAKNAFNALRLGTFKCEIRGLSRGSNGGLQWKSVVENM